MIYVSFYNYSLDAYAIVEAENVDIAKGKFKNYSTSADGWSSGDVLKFPRVSVHGNLYTIETIEAYISDTRRNSKSIVLIRDK